jgi:hypothetical protein
MGAAIMAAATMVVAATNTAGATHVAKTVRMVIVVNRQQGGMGVIVVTAHLLHIKMSRAKFARNMGILQASVGGATAMMMMIMMMMTHIMMRKVRIWPRMVLILIGILIRVPQIISPVN